MVKLIEEANITENIGTLKLSTDLIYNHRKPSVMPQMGSGGRVVRAQPHPYLMEVGRLFQIDSWLK